MASLGKIEFNGAFTAQCIKSAFRIANEEGLIVIIDPDELWARVDEVVEALSQTREIEVTTEGARLQDDEFQPLQ